MFPLDCESFFELYSGKMLYVYIFISVANALLLLLSSGKLLLSLQQSSYKRKRFFKWLVSPETPYLSRLMLLCILGFLFFCLLNVCFASLIGVVNASFLGFVSYLLFTLLYIRSEKAVNVKIPIKKTRRLVFLCITYGILIALFTFALIMLLNYIAYVSGSEIVGVLRFSLICGMPILLPYILFIAYCVNDPMECLIRKHYLKITKNKLDKADVIKIGITGSFGKTSVKEILKTILSQKYRVLATPKSFNTPLGISLAVKGLDSTHDIFIAEMGARNKGDIKELANLVKPKYGILTGVNNQHLETFGCIENTINAKYELFENMAEGGIGFFSSDNENSTLLSKRFKGEKYIAGLNDNNNTVSADNISVSSSGTEFMLKIKGEKPIKCNTVLLGKHSISNICLASALAYKIGLKPEEIAQGINRIKSIEHRLEIVPNNKDIVIIDDSFNSNVDGANSALEVLDMFKGRKIVVTPGLVELGKAENVENFELGKKLAKCADEIIVVGKHNAEMIISGLIDGGKEKEKIRFAKSSNRGNDVLNCMLQKGDVVLFLNDLPDNYS